MTTSAPRRAWTNDEDKRLREAVAMYGPRQWGHIAAHVGQRKDWQCRERWHNNLAPELKKDAWSAEEDETLLHSFEVLGMKWAQIKTLLPGRTGHALKNRYHSLRRRTRVKHKDPPSPPASDALASPALEPHGPPPNLGMLHAQQAGQRAASAAAAAAAVATSAGLVGGAPGVTPIEQLLQQQQRQRQQQQQLALPHDLLQNAHALRNAYSGLSALHVPPFAGLQGLAQGQSLGATGASSLTPAQLSALTALGLRGSLPTPLGPQQPAMAKTPNPYAGLAQLSSGAPAPTTQPLLSAAAPPKDQRSTICQLSAQLLSLAEMGSASAPAPVVRKLIDERLRQLRATVLGQSTTGLEDVAPATEQQQINTTSMAELTATQLRPPMFDVRLATSAAQAQIPVPRVQLSADGSEHVDEYDDGRASPIAGTLGLTPSMSALDELDTVAGA